MKAEVKQTNDQRPSIDWENSEEVYSINICDIPESERYYCMSSGAQTGTPRFYLVLTKKMIGNISDKGVACWLGKNTTKEDVLEHNPKVFAKIFDDGETTVGVLCKSKWEKW